MHTSSEELPDFDESYDVEEPKKTRLSLHMLVRRNLPPLATKWHHEKILEELNKVTHLRLDRENIGYIDSLELLGGNIRNIYLQQNKIQTIEGFETVQNLGFLTLANNRIRIIEGLVHLKKLRFLDLSDNFIETFDIDELPQSLIILNLQNNPCTSMSDYRGRIIQDLANLRQLDGIEVTQNERQKAGYDISSEEEGDAEFDIDKEIEEEEQEEMKDKDDPAWEKFKSTPSYSIKQIFEATTNDILVRSQERLEDTLRDHKKRLYQLDKFRISRDLPPSPRTVFTARAEKKPPVLDASNRSKLSKNLEG